jgi:hypothetical protein
MRKLKQPIKVIDNFFEAPDLWRHYALKQKYNKENATWPGVRSETLDTLNMKMFNSFASKVIAHTHDCNYFSFLKINFAIVDESYNLGWLHQDESQYNVAGVIFMNKGSPKNTGLSFFHKISESQKVFNDQFFRELEANPSDRKQFIPYKEEQRSLFKKDMTVENVFNRCVMFSPDKWHAADRYFGNTQDDSRLTINFFGIAL